MPIPSTVEYLVGSHLQSAVEEVSESIDPIIEGFLYKDSVLMVFAKPGKGKSTAMLQAMLQGTIGEEIFGGLSCPKPFTTLWLQAERHHNEPLVRMKHMVRGIKTDLWRFIFPHGRFSTIEKEMKGIKGINLLNPMHQEHALGYMDRIYKEFPFDVCVVDPIYATVAGGLSGDKEASMVTRFSDAIQEKFNCTNILIHHTNRGSRDKDGQRVEGDMFGSSYLENHISGAFVMNEKEGEGVELKCLKDNFGVLRKTIPLTFYPDTMLSYMPKDQSQFSRYDILMKFLRTSHANHKKFTFRDMIKVSGFSDAHLRRLVYTELKEKLNIAESGVGKQTVYSFVGDKIS